MNIDPSIAFAAKAQEEDIESSGREPRLGGELRDKAVWVDESICIGCKYCAHVASNTFVIEPGLGRSRAFSQDGDTTPRIQEAIDTCPVNCIHWVRFEDVKELRAQLDEMQLQDLGKLPKIQRSKKIFRNLDP